jgi:hypothetical protein
VALLGWLFTGHEALGIRERTSETVHQP